MFLKVLAGLWATCVLVTLPATLASAATTDVVLYASDATNLHGNWARVPDATAAGGQLMSSVDRGWSSTVAPQAVPADSFDFTFTAPANTSYHIWVRLRAASNSKWNDSLFAQFSDARDTNGAAVFALGSTSALTVNLATCFLASSVVQRFEGTIERVAVLAALMPIVASMGGIAGTQTVTLIIRGLALGQVQWSNARWLLLKEIGVGGLNGLIAALLVGAITVLWLGTWKIALVIGAAMLINLLAAASVGVLIPLLLRRMKIDPALSAGVILTTFTDCIGFATLLGLGTLFLT